MELVGSKRLGVVGVAVALVAGALVSEPAAAAEPEAGGASGTSAPAGTLLESILVPVDGSTTVSSTALDAGTHYTLLATGEFRIGGPGFGDAEYAYSGTNQGPIDNCFDSPAGTDLGIGIDDANVAGTSKSPDWGPFNDAHEYTVEVVGTGNPISVNYHDCGHSDNGPAAGRLPLTLSIFAPPTEKNVAPVAVLDLADITTGTPGTPLYSSDDPDLSSPIALVGPKRQIAFDASRSADADGTEDIVSYRVSVTGGPVGEAPSVTTAFTPTGVHVLVGPADRPTQWSVSAEVTDASGASSTVTTVITLDPVQAPVGNRPPIALFADLRADADADRLVNLDPGLSYDGDPGDEIARWQIDLIHLDGAVTLVDRGEGAPPRAVPTLLPKDQRGGFAYARLTVSDTHGAVGQAVEVIGFNQCSAGVFRQPLPPAVLAARKAATEPGAAEAGPAAFLNATLTEGTTRLAAGVLTGKAPLTVKFADQSFHRNSRPLVAHTLADISDVPALYGASTALVRESATPIAEEVVLQNPYGVPIPVTFALQVTDDAGVESVHIVTVVVQPTSSPVLDMAITQNATDPMAIDVTPVVTGIADKEQHAWLLATTGTNAFDVFRTFTADDPLKTQTIRVPRGPGVAIRANVRFQYGGAELNDGLLVERTLCRDHDLPVLGQAQANEPPTLTVTPAVQHATGAVRLHIHAEDPDPVVLGDIASEFVGFGSDDVVGMLEVTVNGQSAQELGAVYVPGSNPFDFDVELPAAPPGRRDLVVEAMDFFGGRTTTTVTVYDDPPTMPISAATITMQHTPANLIRGEQTTESVTLFTPAFVPFALMVVDLPSDATMLGATTAALGQTGLVNAITAASQPLPGRWTCTQYIDTAKTRLVCSSINPIPTPNFAFPRLDLRFTSTSSKSQLQVTAGATQPHTGLTLDEHLASLRDLTSTDSLRVDAADTVPLRGFTVNAGPDQTVDALTTAPDGSTSPTVVTLDASGSSNDGRPQTYQWRQISGTPVSWKSATSGTGTALRALGQVATFTAPTVMTATNIVFEVSVAVPAAPGLAAQTKTGRVTITVNPPPNRAPSITGLVSTPDATNSTPAAGATLSLRAGGSDPDGDGITFTWRAWRGTGTTGTTVNTKAGANSSERTLSWPATTPQLTVEVTATDRRGLSAVRRFVFGAALAPIQLNITGTVAAAPIGASTPTATAGEPVSLTVSSNRAPSGGITWSLVSGPAIPGVTFPKSGATLTFAAPTVTSSGQQLVVRATAVDATGTVTAEQTFALTPVPPPSVALVVWPGNGAPPGPGSGLLDFLQPVLVPPGGLLSAAATATGTGALGYSWSTSPAMTIAAPTSASTTMTAPTTDVFVTVKVRVTDATGASAEATRLVQVGAGLPSIDLTCAGSSVMNDLIRQARDNANRVSGLLDVSVPLGLPPVGTVNLGKVTFAGDCTTDPAISFSGAGITLYNGFLGGTGLTGTVSTDRVCFTGGQVTLPAELGLGTATAGTPANPLCVSLDPTEWTRPDPPLPTPSPPAANEPPRTGPGTTPPDPALFRLPTITCPAGVSPISGSIDWPGTFPGTSLAGVVPKRTSARFDCGFIELTSTASTPWGDLALRGLARRDGSFDAAVVTKGLRLFGKTTNTDLTGTFTRSATGTIVWSVGADISAPSLGTDAITLPTLHVELSTSGFGFSAAGQLHAGGNGPVVDVALAGTITGQDEFTATLTGSLAAPWQPLPGLNIAAGALTASVARVAGVTTFDVALGVTGDWQPVPALSVRQLTARLSNRAAPADCAITAGRTWAELTGTARVEIGAPAPVIDLTVRACVGIDQPSVLITSTANLNSWKPVPSQDFTFNSVGLAIRKPLDGDWTIDVVGNADYAGIALAGRARFTPTTGSFVLDAAGDLSGLHLGPVSSGHVVFTNNPTTNYVPVPLPSDPPSGAAPINLVTGVTAFADINLDASTRAALDKVLNPPAPQPKVLPIPESIRFVAQLGGASLRLKASISFPPGQGLTLFATCPEEAPKVGAQCVLTHKLTTSLRLTTFFLSIDTTGRFGFGGEADLQLASSDGVAPRGAPLHVTAEASVDVTAPSIDLALYYTGDWENALGINGLTLRDLAIQGGVNFASPIPIPTIGFGATVARLPDPVAAVLGIQNDPPEPMRFVVNISPTKPIFELTLGQPDGHMFLKPVQPLSAANANALTIDYASLVFAPLGGDVGPYHYEPGISIGFAGTAMGIAASGSARITLVPPNLHADLDVGEIVFGTGSNATRIKGTHLLFDVTPTSVVIEASGGIRIANGPEAAVRLNVNATLLPPSASATFNLDVTNWNLPFGGASVQELHASANLAASFGSLPSGNLSVNGVLRAGTTNVTASGSLTLSNGRLTAMALQGNVSNFAIAGVSFTGPGCDGTGPQTGACISAGFDAAQNPPLSLGVAGSLSVQGQGVDVVASFGPTGLHASGSLRVAALGNPTITGDLWFGSALGGVTARDGQGVLRQVQAGDFRFTAQANGLPSPLNGSSLDVDLGRIGGSAWIKGAGQLRFSGRDLASATIRLDNLGMAATGDINVPSPVPGGVALSIHLDGRVDFATATRPLGFSLSGSLAAQSSSADPSLRALAQGSFTLSRAATAGAATVFAFSASVALPGISGSFSGNIATNMTFCFNGSFTFAALGVNGTASLGNNCSTPGLRVRVVVGGFTFDGRLTATGTVLTASFDDTRQLMVQGTHSYFFPTDQNQVQDWVRFTTAVNGSLAWSNSGFALTSSFAASGRVVWDVRCATPRTLSPSNSFCRIQPAGSVYVTNFDATLGISVSNNKLCATIPGLGEHCV